MARVAKVNGNVISLKDFIPPRPPGIPDNISAEKLVEAVQGFILGDAHCETAEALGISLNALYRIQRGPAWRAIQNFVRDEFQLSVGSRMMRIENKLLNKIEDYVDNGCTITFVDEKGRLHETSREITPKEAVSIALMMNEVNKRVDKVKSGDFTRKEFDPQGWLRKLEKAAKVVSEKEVEGQSVREPE